LLYDIARKLPDGAQISLMIDASERLEVKAGRSNFSLPILPSGDFPKMTADQALLLKTYDSETDGRARFMGHSAFEDPNTPVDAPLRQSIELRAMAFF